MGNTIEGRVWKFGDGMNTDLLLPMHASLRPPEKQTAYVFEANRPGWAQQVEAGDIIVAGRYFGIGSSRPAAQVLRNLGIAAVVADGVNGLFMRNAINFGLPCFDADGVTAMFVEGDVARINNVEWRIANRRTGAAIQAIALPDNLRKIMLTGGLRAHLQAEGYIAAPTAVSE